MTPIISKKDIELINEVKKWLYIGEDNMFYLRDDAPEKIKQNYKKIQDIYIDF